MSRNRLAIATRGSDLALAQTRQVIQRLVEIEPTIEPQIIPIVTRGDQNPDTPLWKLPGSGFFTAQVEAALLENRADWAVHSLKDLPSEIRPELTIAAVLPRANPADTLVSRAPLEKLDDLSENAVVGTSSPRRAALLASLRSDLDIRPLRGNIPTRLEKLRRGDYDAIVVAAAALERLGVQNQFHRLQFDPATFVPAAGQGIIAVQARADDRRANELARRICHLQTAVCAQAERAALAALHPGCHTPLGVFAELKNDRLTLYAFAAPLAGWPTLRRSVSGQPQQADQLAAQLVEQLKQAGIDEILNAFENPKNE